VAVNVPQGDLVQYTAALGAALLARHRLQKINDQDPFAHSASETVEVRI